MYRESFSSIRKKTNEREIKFWRGTRSVFVLIFISLYTVVPCLKAQDEVIRVETDLVNIPVSVFYRDGRYVADLTQKEFRIFEDGIEQDVAVFSPVSESVTIMILVDVSSSLTNSQSTEMVEAINILVQKLRHDDTLIAATYSYRTYPILNETKVGNIKKSIKIELHPYDAQTLIYDAVDYALKKMRKVRGKKAIILFGDGTDSGLSASFKGTIKDAEEGETIIYPIQYRLRPNPPYTDPKKFQRSIEKATDYMTSLAQKTGGRHFFVDEITDLRKSFEDISVEMRSQYLIGYYPITIGKKEERRRITVKVDRPDVAVRSRTEVVYTRSKSQ